MEQSLRRREQRVNRRATNLVLIGVIFALLMAMTIDSDGCVVTAIVCALFSMASLCGAGYNFCELDRIRRRRAAWRRSA